MDIKTEIPDAPDGEYCLELSQGTRTFLVETYCSSMSAIPKEFITLLAGEEENYSKTQGRSERYFTGDMFFSKIALDLGNLNVKADDHTFSRMENKKGNEKRGSVPAWGKAWSCNECTDTSFVGELSIALTGTVFQLPQNINFSKRGKRACTKKMVYSDSFQTVKATCGGDCGGCLPKETSKIGGNIPLVINSSLSASNCTANYVGDVGSSGLYDKQYIYNGFLKQSANLLSAIASVFKPYVLISLTLENKVDYAYGHCQSNVQTSCTTLPYKSVEYDMTSILAKLSVWVYQFMNVKSTDNCYTQILVISVQLTSLGNQVFRCYIL